MTHPRSDRNFQESRHNPISAAMGNGLIFLMGDLSVTQGQFCSFP